MNEKPQAAHASDVARPGHAWSRAIHWITVILMMGVLVTALLEPIDPHGSGNTAFRWHSAMGLAIYLLAVTRGLLWIMYRPALRTRSYPNRGMEAGLRIAFYALLVALPLSGWVLATEEGMSTHRILLPLLPQWVHEDHAARSKPFPNGLPRDVSPAEDPLIARLSRIHAILGATLAFVITLRIRLAVKTYVQRRATRTDD